ncbi:MAG: cellulase family glycosylhydrolase [Chloroflexi bacterium]|nr:cellulase family glycosylhydrolase [Chloroflexota bacterium]
MNTRLLRAWKMMVGTALVLLIAALFPPTLDLYELTGEENLAAQLRGVVHWLNTAVRPQPSLALEAAVQPTAVSPFAANTFLQQEVEPAKREQSLQLLRDAGFRFIRQEFTWEDIEIHGKGEFEDRRNVAAIGVVDAWAKYDNIVDLAEAYDVQIIARLSNPPAWTRALTDTIGTYAPPDDFADFGDYAAAVAQRYQGRVHYYQLWNEPNGNQEWGLQDVDPEAYTALLCEGYRRIKEVDPQAVILAAALTPTLAMDGRHMNDLIFLQRMYNAGAADCFDVAAAQGYGLWSGATDRRLRPTVINYPHNLFIRDLMVRNGDAEKPIWISEMGWNTAPEPIPATYGRVSEEQQARYTVEAFQRQQAEWPWVGVNAVWFFRRPADWEMGEAWYYFRMMEPDFTPLPVFTAVAEYATSDQTIKTRPAWLTAWDGVRPFLFTFSSAILFFALLWFLAPKSKIGD